MWSGQRPTDNGDAPNGRVRDIDPAAATAVSKLLSDSWGDDGMASPSVRLGRDLLAVASRGRRE